MRDLEFLRTPIKASEESKLRNLKVSEQPVAANPAAGDVYPQTLIISFDVDRTVTEIELVPLWEGQFVFLADDTTGYPTKPEEVVPENFSKWNLKGDLVLHSSRGFAGEASSIESAFEANVPFIKPAPSSVRYSKVRLTRDFIFTTLANMPRFKFINSGVKVEKDDPQWLGKLVLGFLRAKTDVPCAVHKDDPNQDFANSKMPSVHLATDGSATTFTVVIATRAPESERILSDWFAQNPAFDNISGEPLVPPGLGGVINQRFNPAHPGHSVISAFALYRSAEDFAYAPGYDAAKPIRSALTAPRADGAVYRRIDLIRPPMPGNALTSSYPQRPFPQYQLVWQAAAEVAQSLRIPLTGRLYLPLLDQDYTFWAIPRSKDPDLVTEGTEFQLSRKQPAKKYIDLAKPKVTYMPEIGDEPQPLYAHLVEYDSRVIWAQMLGIDPNEYKSKAKPTWNVTVLSLFIFRIAAMAAYARIYGYIRAAASRHGFAPEFLHAVYMGEGIGGDGGLIEDHRKNGVPYADREPICGFLEMGLDDIEVNAPALEASGYLDHEISVRLTNPHTHPNEEKPPRNVRTADVVGWEAGAEMVAAELHSRLDQMLAYCTSQGITITTEEELRFLAYMRFNVSLPTAQGHADHIYERMRPWVGPEPTDQMDERFNTLQRLAITKWYELAQVYR
jgi:hypothetical protein